MKLPPLRVLTGPTACGKSAAATEIARREGGEILLADSMQLYKELDLGTGKPSATERAAVRRHLLDWKEPHESCSAAEWLRAAEVVIADCAARGVPLLVEGGTALYLKALGEGLFEGPGRNEQLRAELEREADEHGLPALYSELKKAAPATAAKILPGDRRRIVRALEIIAAGDKSPDELRTQWGRPRRDLDVRFVLLDPPRKALYTRIDRRVQRMIAAGWVEECRKLAARHPPLSREASQALGYRTLFAYLRGELTLEAATERICFDTHHFARRQFNWFKRFLNVRRLPVKAAELAALDGSESERNEVVRCWADAALELWFDD